MKFKEKKSIHYYYIISPLYVYMLLLFFALNQLLVSALIVTSAPGGSPSRQLSSSSSALNHNVSNNINKNSLNNTSSNRSANTAEPLAVVSKKFGNKLSGNWTYLPQVPPVSSAAQPYHMVATNHRSLASHHFNGSSSSLTIQQGSPTKYPSLKVLNGDFKKKICIGTSNRLSKLQNKDHHYQNIRDRYTNCTYVDGNLEITWLQHDVDLSFLDSIREVTGYVLIAYVNVAKIKMHNLQIIRGRELFSTMSMSDDKYALLVTYSSMLRNLELPGLRDILNGNVGIFESPNMCHIKSIYWEEILSGPDAKTFYYYNNTVPKENCPCNACDNGCWSEEPQMCQVMKRKGCSPQCGRQGCYGPNQNECCHAYCAGGCSGPTQSDCLACKNFYDDGVCRQECPSMYRYNPSSFSWESNPDAKYAYGANCVKNCPDHLLRDNGACVRTCPPNKRNQNGECVACVGPCPKNCQGVENVNSGNIESFKGCTQIEGSITILDTSFDGYTEVYPNMSMGAKHRPMSPSELEVFSTLREITGFLNIQANHSDFKDLSCFRNLERIEGRQTTDMFTTLNILKTSLVSLKLRSLKHIRSGKVAIVENSDLCFADTLKWEQIVAGGSKEAEIKLNAESSKCKSRGLVCHEQCSQDGCWGPQSDECLTCKNFKLDGRCVKDCQSDPISSYDAGNSTCKRCHEECANGCTGPESRHCRKCKNVRDGPYCVHECPISKYNSSGSCLPCHESCASGCTGPMNKTGPLGCNSCQKTVLGSSDFSSMDNCIKFDDQCPVGYYQDHNENRLICRKCHHRCKTCTAMGTHVSVCECSAYELGENCDVGCPRDYYADGKRCVRCSLSCNGCRGPTEADCLACRHFRVYHSSPENSSSFNCTEYCPKDRPFRNIHDAGDFYCSDKDNNSELLPDYSVTNTQGTAMTLSIIIVSLFLFFIYKCQRVRSEENTAKLTMRMTSGFEDDEPLQRSNIEPNLAKLNIIQESDLRVGKKLGAGIGGIVYQGQWIDSGKNSETLGKNGEILGKNKSIKRLVAIKVLRDGSNMNNEFLEEAKLMASVNHPNLVKLLAVCMTSKLMLITELMPLGCLSEYVRSCKDNIRPMYLLNWCSQIAKGMAYLEEKKIVHRDLALRNVLVQTTRRVLITDFGLAKWLDHDEGEYKSLKGKLPVRWLAPECIEERIFTHKSDVWAFGVTVWELLTYGMIPYSNVETKNVPNEVMRGLRLKQPENASLDVFCTMAKCWMQPEDRPSFDELVKDFSKYRLDPWRYLVIPGGKLTSQQNCSQESDSRTLPIDELFVTPLNSPFPLTPCKKAAFNFARSPNISMNHDTESIAFCISDNNNNMRKDAMDANLTTNRNNFNSNNFETLAYPDGKNFTTEFDFHGSHNFPFPRTPIKTAPPTDDLSPPVDDDDYLLPSPSFIDASDTMNIIPMDLNGVNNMEYHLKYNYINQDQDPLIQFSRPSTSDDMSSSDQISDSNSITKPDETTV